MSQRRFCVLVLGPLPILVSSIALSSWMRTHAQPAPANVALRHSPATTRLVAHTKSVAQNRSTPRRTDGRSLAADCQAAAIALGKRMGLGCVVISRPPFVLSGDLSATELESWHSRTIGPAARALGHCYFRTGPDKPITVLLFKSADSYDRYAQQLFGDSGISIYGYYKPRERTLVMNISTGGGTLVHELTHALIAFDFPQVPDWFNEGLASLHEQCQIHDEAEKMWIEGFENWRLPALQTRIKQKRLRSLESLIQSDDFRGEQESLNYAQARYFCLYMQRLGLLPAYYREFHSHRADDPTGARSVLAVFKGRTWDSLNRDFQAWAAGLEVDR